MCSISGFYNSHVDFTARKDFFSHILDDMKQTLYHRGPDENGTLLKKHVGLAHTRLSIIDLETGVQPITRRFADYDYTLIFNGEIYNLNELRQRLLLLGHTFMTKSDSEVLLLSFLHFGADFVTDVDGIFAMAIFDERHQTLYLYRDPFGVKPLFYTKETETFVFSSEPKGLFCFPNVTPQLDKNGLCELFGLGPARTPGCGVFQDVFEVLPGTYLSISINGIQTTQYYRLTSHPHTDSYEETIEHTRFLLTDAIRRQMVSDVPICTFLSGGVDSSIVSAVCAAELKKEGKQLHTFSFDFTDNDKYFQSNRFQPSTDRPYVEKMVSALDSVHTYLECDNQTQVDLLERSVDAHDLPCMADIDSSLLYFCGEVSQTHKVVLTGECADEIFGGYPWFHDSAFLSSNAFPWTPNLDLRKSLLNKELLSTLSFDEYVADAYAYALSEISVLPSEPEDDARRRQICYLNIRFFMQTLLNRMDRTSMHCGLEARVPFADKALVEYVFNAPWELKAKGGIVKHLLRESARGLLPDEILFRRKSPYPKTYHPEYEAMLAIKLRNMINETDCPLLPLIDKPALLAFLDSPKDYGKPWYGQLMAGPQMIAYLIQVSYFLKKYHISLDL